MNNLYLLLLSALILSGCASNKYKEMLLSNPDYPVIESSCDDECIKQIEKSTGISIGDYSTASISEAVIQKIDGIYGDVEFAGVKKYNSYWDGEFEIPIKPGKHILDLRPNYMPDKEPYIFSIELSLIQNHKYFIGNYIVGPTHISNWNYKWFPIIFDKTTKELIFPKNEIPWQGKNIRNMETLYINPVK